MDETERGGGIGGRLIDELHARIGASTAYMLLVVEGTERAVTFYERHGLRVVDTVDDVTYYADHMRVRFPPGTSPFRLVMMRRERG